MNLSNVTRQAIRGITNTNSIIQNPLNFVLDNLIRLIVQLLVPIPLASELIVYFKGPILALFA